MGAKQLSIAITGAGGAGVISLGEMLLQAWARAGGRGLLRRAYGPQIRGGESAALLKLTESETYTAALEYDILLALDWANFSRFTDEIALAEGGLVICQAGAALPAAIEQRKPVVAALPLQELARSEHPEGRENMLALGLLGRLLGLDEATLEQLASRKLQGKPSAYCEAAVLNIRLGGRQALPAEPALPSRTSSGGWCLTGNQAAAFGAVAAGVRFVAAYPITPASDALEWLAGAMEATGGNLVQAEDELAAINMTIGAAFGGVPSLTATSGPGLALMTESIGLAVASETPLVVLNVMRIGPSTGIPTKSGQGDLDIALHGLHGDAPHLVLAPLDTADCVSACAWAVELAQQLQCPALVLSDQFLGQSTAIVDEPRRGDWQHTPVDTVQEYRRYQLTESGVSPLAFPGQEGRRFTAEGLEHNEHGRPSARHDDHIRQLAKRSHKLEAFDFGADWAETQGEGTVALISFGSASVAAQVAGELLAAQGLAVKTIALRLLAPLQTRSLAEALADCEQVFVLEQNHGGQLFHYLRGKIDFPGRAHSLAMPGPAPLNPQAVAKQIMEAAQS